MSTIRVQKTDKYTVIANQPINDKTLSWGARGMLAYLLSKPNDWTVSMVDLERQSPAGGHATKTIVKELEKAGYLVRRRTRTKQGKFIWISTIYERPHKTPKTETIPQFSTDGFSTDGKPRDIVNPDLPSTEKPLTRQAAKGDLLDGMIAYEKKRNGRADLSFLYEHLRPLGQAFIDAAGKDYVPMKSEHSKWCKIIGEWYELDYDPDRITRAVSKMRNDGLTIGGPESIKNVARGLSDGNGHSRIVPDDGRIDIF